MTTCPKCNHERNPGDIECPKCGIVFKKYENYRQQEIRKETNKEKNIKGKENQSSKIRSKIKWGIICLSFIVIGISYYFAQEKQSELSNEEHIRNEIAQEQISHGSRRTTPPISPDGDILNSLEASIKYLSKPKFSQNGILNVRDDGTAVCITIEDSFWYNLTISQKQQLANRLLDVIYASGDVKRILYLKDEHSRLIAEQHTENVGGVSMLRPYMDLM